ncbi:hypothetical protein FFI97_020510 [Variovorax sp. KBS0712]|nr:hypothetical protein [Variovorax sp. KBS0712]TSD56596.1 hypothetical protein FFI97_020510 [Variovorax sp. KBS0712]
MPRQTIVLRVFVASPSDVGSERSLLESVLRELNQAWSQTLGVMFELVKWETSVRPAFSSDPQAAINEQIGEDYDVFVGIFWGRLGTATPRASSGSVEEFERAHKRFVATGGSPEILLYFKDAPIAPSKIDIKQLESVQIFKGSLAPRGGLYFSFDDLSSFESSLRSHLAAIAQKFSTERRESGIRLIDVATPAVEAFLVSDEDDFGFMDYIEIYESRQAEMTVAMGVINEAMVRVGEQITLRSKEMAPTSTTDAKNVRRMVKRAADDLNNFSDTVSKELPAISHAREKAYGALSKALVLRGDFTSGDSALLELRTAITTMLKSAAAAKDSVLGLRHSTDSLPRLSKEINQAKREMVRQLDFFISEIDSLLSTVTNIVGAIDRMVESD